MSQQPNVTALSDPAAAVNDSAILGSSTAPPTLVFKPGVVFGNHGPIRQNTYTSPNVSGTDGLVLLQQTVTGQGFFPVLPLPSSEIEFDFSSNADAFALTANLNLGANATVKGLINQANGSIPTLSTSTFTVVPPIEVANLVLAAQAASGQTFTATPEAITFSGRGSVTTNGFPLYALSSGTSNITLKDVYVLGDGTNPVIPVTGGTLTLNMEGFTSLKAGAIPVTGPGTLIINASAEALIDASYFGNAQITINRLNTQPGQTVIFNSVGVASGNVFTTFAAACAAAKTFQGLTTIYCMSGVVPSGTYDAGPTWILELANGTGLFLSEGVQFTTPPHQILCRGAGAEAALLQSNATATTPFTGTGSQSVTLHNIILISGSVTMFDYSTSSGGVTCYGIPFGGSASCVYAQNIVIGRSKYSTGFSFITAGPNIRTTSGGKILCIEETSIGANTIVAGAGYTFSADISCSIAPAQSGVPGGVLTITWLNNQPLNTIPYTPGNASKWAGGTVASLQAAIDRIAAVVGTPIPIP
jgi:hypothetical protein